MSQVCSRHLGYGSEQNIDLVGLTFQQGEMVNQHKDNKWITSIYSKYMNVIQKKKKVDRGKGNQDAGGERLQLQL